VGHIGLEISKIAETEQYIELFFILFDTGIGISIEDKDNYLRIFRRLTVLFSGGFAVPALAVGLYTSGLYRFFTSKITYIVICFD
jgi:hypothetical protein